MRKIFSLILSLNSIVLMAQKMAVTQGNNSTQTTAENIEFIPTVGFSSYTLVGYGVNVKYKNAIRVGLLVEAYGNPKWGFRMGVFYDNMGAIDGFGTQLTLKYISVPINANYHFSRSKNWNFNFGLMPGILRISTSNGSSISRLLNPYQVSLSLGIGYKIRILENMSLVIDYQYVYGLTSVFKDSRGGNVYNVGGALGIGMVFKL